MIFKTVIVKYVIYEHDYLHKVNWFSNCMPLHTEVISVSLIEHYSCVWKSTPMKVNVMLGISSLSVVNATNGLTANGTTSHISTNISSTMC